MKRACKCCGNITVDNDSLFEICSVCGWESDVIQEENPDYIGGANDMSLNQYKDFYFCLPKPIEQLNLQEVGINEYFRLLKLESSQFSFEWIKQYKNLLSKQKQGFVTDDIRKHYFSLFVFAKEQCEFLLSKYPNYDNADDWKNGILELDKMILSL